MQRTRHAANDHGTMDALKDRVGVMGATVRDIGEIVKDAVTEKLTELRDGALDLGAKGKERVVEKVSEAREDLEERIEAKPLTSIFLAAGVGVLLGMFLRRR
jgi:ElaB/YqjD/DUF883 family membrane-anchored ribosome-binding protein